MTTASLVCAAFVGIAGAAIAANAFVIPLSSHKLVLHKMQASDLRLTNNHATNSSSHKFVLHKREASDLRLTNNHATDSVSSPRDGEAKRQRRNFLFSALLSASTGSFFISSPPANAIERAVGAAEKSCREQGNCLERGDWDGAVGWNWGGRDRCDPTDPRCGIDGTLRESAPTGKPVPKLNGLRVTHVVEMDLNIGKQEKGTIRFGLYGENCPTSVKEMVDFCTSSLGLVTNSRLMLEEGYGAISSPLFLGKGGVLNVIYPEARLDFGVPSQAAAYARAKGLSKAGDEYVPQVRPTKGLDALALEPFVRNHDVAGLISLPVKGLGYGGSGFESDDEAFESAFQITAGDQSSMDREGRRVVGQVMDNESMGVVARLSSLPTRKGLKGIIPGQNAGPPLFRVTVSSVTVSTSSVEVSGDGKDTQAS